MPIRRHLTLDTVWWLLPLAMAAMWVFLTPIHPADFWYHAAYGRTIAESGAVPTVDAFTYTQAGQPYYYQPWLAGLLLYWLMAAGGVTAVLLADAALLVGAYLMLLRWTMERSRSLPLVSALCFMTMPIAGNWNARPQTFAIPVFVALAWLLDRQRRTGRAPLWLLPPLMIAWANLHGTFAVGLILLGIAFVGELLWTRGRPRSPTALAWMAAAALCIVVNPRGLGLLGYLRGMLTSAAVTHHSLEWMPVSLDTALGVLVTGYTLLVALALLRARRWPAPAELLSLLALGWIAFTSVRGVMWFLWLTIPVFAEALAARRADAPAPAARPAGSAPLNGLLLVMVLAAVVVTSPFVKPSLPLDSRMGPLVDRETPIAAVEALRADPDRPRRLFHTLEFGSYLTWAAPEIPICADTRFEFHPPEFWTAYLDLLDGRDVGAHLAALQADGVLLPPRMTAALQAIRATGEWTTRYEDDVAVCLERAR